MKKSVRKIGLGPSLDAAFGFLPRAWARAGGSVILIVVLGALGPVLQASGYQNLAKTGALGGAWVFAIILAGYSLLGGLYRLALSPRGAKPKGLGPFGVQFSGAEVRLLAAHLLIFLFFSLILIAAFVLYTIAAAAAGLTSEAQMRHGFAGLPWWKQAVFYVIGLGTLWTTTTLSLRLSLHGAATVAEQKVVSLNALALGEGHVLALAAGLLISVLPTLLVLGALALAPWPAARGLAGLGAVLIVWFGVSTPVQVKFLAEVYQRVA